MDISSGTPKLRRGGSAVVAVPAGRMTPTVTDFRWVKKDPRDGSLFTHHLIVATRKRWKSLPESKTGDWDELVVGPLVVASKIIFAPRD